VQHSGRHQAPPTCVKDLKVILLSSSAAKLCLLKSFEFLKGWRDPFSHRGRCHG
jgi:hypothetical protein